jgi:hypothetical protein
MGKMEALGVESKSGSMAEVLMGFALHPFGQCVY